ncbi:CoA transferase [Undibacterium sp. TJN25]|uniref:CoA transferase n=1 Tax=Undibacterium sp. TJN25 TaxID=3413056 RepID=UPI003BF1B871
MDAHAALQSFWQLGGGDASAPAMVSFTEADTQLPSVFQVGPLASASIAAQALAAAEFWRLRTGQRQQIQVPMRKALAMFRSERYLTVDGKPPAEIRNPLTGYFQAGDGRWLQLHTNFPHHRDGVLKVLRCENFHSAVAAAIREWSAAELDERLAQQGMCAALIRSPQEWQAHPQAAAIAGLPLLEIIRMGDAPAEPPRQAGETSAARPLSGVRVLDLSRVIAAPVAGRTLAQHGAEVLAISAAHLPDIAPLVIDTGRGKRSAQLDLRTVQGRENLRELIGGADIFLQAYRPGALAGLGFTSEELCALRPGLIQVSLSAYSHAGPWAGRRGFDSLVQSATGIAYTEGRAAGLAEPGKLPCQALDHATGYLAAFGAMTALKRRAEEGGSWLVRVSLAQTGNWLQSQERLLPGQPTAELTQQEINASLHVMESPFGRVSAVAPVEQMNLTPPGFDKPPVPLGTHAAAW